MIHFSSERELAIMHFYLHLQDSNLTTVQYKQSKTANSRTLLMFASYMGPLDYTTPPGITGEYLLSNSHKFSIYTKTRP